MQLVIFRQDEGNIYHINPETIAYIKVNRSRPSDTVLTIYFIGGRGPLTLHPGSNEQAHEVIDRLRTYTTPMMAAAQELMEEG